MMPVVFLIIACIALAIWQVRQDNDILKLEERIEQLEDDIDEQN